MGCWVKLATHILVKQMERLREAFTQPFSVVDQTSSDGSQGGTKIILRHRNSRKKLSRLAVFAWRLGDKFEKSHQIRQKSKIGSPCSKNKKS